MAAYGGLSSCGGAFVPGAPPRAAARCGARPATGAVGGDGSAHCELRCAFPRRRWPRSAQRDVSMMARRGRPTAAGNGRAREKDGDKAEKRRRGGDVGDARKNAPTPANDEEEALRDAMLHAFSGESGLFNPEEDDRYELDFTAVDWEKLSAESSARSSAGENGSVGGADGDDGAEAAASFPPTIPMRVKKSPLSESMRYSLDYAIGVVLDDARGSGSYRQLHPFVNRARRAKQCVRCEGAGMVRCKYCKGQGVLRLRAGEERLRVTFQQTVMDSPVKAQGGKDLYYCPLCGGLRRTRCEQCFGSGVLPENARRKFDVAPNGVSALEDGAAVDDDDDDGETSGGDAGRRRGGDDNARKGTRRYGFIENFDESKVEVSPKLGVRVWRRPKRLGRPARKSKQKDKSPTDARDDTAAAEGKAAVNADGVRRKRGRPRKEESKLETPVEPLRVKEADITQPSTDFRSVTSFIMQQRLRREAENAERAAAQFEEDDNTAPP